MADWRINPETGQYEQVPPQNNGVTLSGIIQDLVRGALGGDQRFPGSGVQAPPASNSGIGAMFSPHAPLPRTGPTPPPVPLSGAIEYDLPTMLAQSGGASFTPAPIPEAPTIPAPPPRVADPSLGAREQYMTERGERLSPMFTRMIKEEEASDPRNSPWWSRLGSALGVVAASDTLAESGANVGEFYANEAERRSAIRDRVMRLGLAQEDINGEGAEARFARMSGEHEATQGTAQDVYQTDIQNRENSYNQDVAQTQQTNQAGLANFSANRELTIAQYEQAQQELRTQLLEAARSGDSQAYSAIMGRLPEDMQRRAVEDRAKAGLGQLILETVPLPENGELNSSGIRAIHRRMEGLVGHQLPLPNIRDMRSLEQVVEYYSQFGLLSNPEVLNAFPGFEPPVPTRRTITERAE